MHTQSNPMYLVRRRGVARRAIALALAAACVAGPGAAFATPIGDTKYDSPGAGRAATGDTPADLAQPRVLMGDTKYDSPGASRAAQYEAPEIHVFRPATTVVRDANDALPIALASGALLLALAGAAVAVQRTGGVHLRRSH